jgi:hypothetical protein
MLGSGDVFPHKYLRVCTRLESFHRIVFQQVRVHLLLSYSTCCIAMVIAAFPMVDVPSILVDVLCVATKLACTISPPSTVRCQMTLHEQAHLLRKRVLHLVPIPVYKVDLTNKVVTRTDMNFWTWTRMDMNFRTWTRTVAPKASVTSKSVASTCKDHMGKSHAR